MRMTKSHGRRGDRTNFAPRTISGAVSLSTGNVVFQNLIKGAGGRQLQAGQAG